MLTDGNVLLDVEVAGVEERPETTLRRLGENARPGLAEDEGDDLKEELADEDSLRTEVEDLLQSEARVSSRFRN